MCFVPFTFRCSPSTKLSCCQYLSVFPTLPNLVGILLLMVKSAPEFPAEDGDVHQQDEDEEQGTHSGANYHCKPVWGWKSTDKRCDVGFLRILPRKRTKLRKIVCIFYHSQPIVRWLLAFGRPLKLMRMHRWYGKAPIAQMSAGLFLFVCFLP